MNIIKATILTGGNAMDTINLQTDLPPSYWPYNESPSVTLQVAAGKGEEYFQENFPELPYEIIRV